MENTLMTEESLIEIEVSFSRKWNSQVDFVEDPCHSHCLIIQKKH